MKISGELDPALIKARRVLLDALEALKGQLHAIVLVGAQAIYLHTGDADLAVAPFTQDADLALNPHTLGSIPVLAEAMQKAGFLQKDQPGVWVSQQEGGTVDLLVPETLGGRPGKRAAHLEGHGNNVARQVCGLEATLVDQEMRLVTALERQGPAEARAPVTIERSGKCPEATRRGLPHRLLGRLELSPAFGPCQKSDTRSREIAIAGPSALLVAKLHKIAERLHEPRRIRAKDALDIFRLLQAVPSETLAARFALLQGDPLSLKTTQSALKYLQDLFGTETGTGTKLAADAAYPLAESEFITTSCAGLTQELMRALPSI